MSLRVVALLAVAGCGLDVGGGAGELFGSEGTGTPPPSTSTPATPSDDTSTTSGAPTPNTSTSSDSENATDEISYDLPVPDAPNDVEVPFDCAHIDKFPRTSTGCEFFAVDTPLFEQFGENDLSWGISIGNPSEDVATVEIQDRRGAAGAVRVLDTVVIAPQDSELVRIGGTWGLLPDEDHQVAPEGTHVAGAFRVVSDVPVTAMQINPMGGAESFVPEASLLLPTNSLDTSHFAVGYEHFQWQFGGVGWVLVVAIEDDTTVTTIEGDVPLEAFDVHHFNPGADATGYFVGADKPVAVFSGVGCTEVPDGFAACDHLEEQVLPLAAWGTEYVAARHPRRMPEQNFEDELVYWRIIAGVDDQDIHVTPSHIFGAGTIHIDTAGQHHQIVTRNPFVAHSDDPFMVVQYMSGCNTVGACIQNPDEVSGDPYMIQMVPVDQWLDTLPFLTDTSYPRDFVVISRQAGTSVDLECLGTLDDDRFTGITGTDYEFAFVDLDLDGSGGEGSCEDGQQFLTASEPVGVYVAGISVAASYGYPGGMHIETLWDPPQEPAG